MKGNAMDSSSVISVYDYGFRLVRQGGVSNSAPTEKRGRVTSFSRSSRLRMREFLLSFAVPDRVPFGVTLTIPEQADKEMALRLFSVAVHRLRVYFVRRRSTGFVWRVELQRNRMPHLHIVSYESPLLYDVQSFWMRLWADIVLKLFDVPSLAAFLRRGVHSQPLDGKIAAYRYICDHGSKSKQAQLGYVGRQWGVVGRKYFYRKYNERFPVPPCLFHRFLRFVRRVTSFSVKCPCVFGCKHIRRKGVNAVSYVSRPSVMRFLRFCAGDTAFCKALVWILFPEHQDLPF